MQTEGEVRVGKRGAKGRESVGRRTERAERERRKGGERGRRERKKCRGMNPRHFLKSDDRTSSYRITEVQKKD